MMSENYNTAKPINRIQYWINYTENFIIILALWTLCSRTRANFSILLKQQFLLFLPRQQLFFYFPPRQEQIFIFHNTTTSPQTMTVFITQLTTVVLYSISENSYFYLSSDIGFCFQSRHTLISRKRVYSSPDNGCFSIISSSFSAAW